MSSSSEGRPQNTNISNRHHPCHPISESLIIHLTASLITSTLSSHLPPQSPWNLISFAYVIQMISRFWFLIPTPLQRWPSRQRNGICLTSQYMSIRHLKKRCSYSIWTHKPTWLSQGLLWYCLLLGLTLLFQESYSLTHGSHTNLKYHKQLLSFRSLTLQAQLR